MRFWLACFGVLLAIICNGRASFAQDDKKPPAASAEAAAGGDEQAEAVHYKVGVQLENITGFDAAKGTFSAEFVLFIRCDKEPCQPHIDAVNARAALATPEKLRDDKLLKIYKYKAELNALVDFEEFPFDEHVLPILLEDKSETVEVTWELDKDTTSFDKEKCKLPGFTPTHWLAAVVKEDIGGGESVSQLRFGLAITRQKFASFMSNLLPPLVMALFVMGATLFLRAKSAQGRLAGISGSLLALVMFHKSALPAGATFTMLDKFMIATYLVYALNIVLTVVMLRAEEQKRQARGELAYLVAWGLVPGFALVAWTAVFSGLL
jgi:hypothetical protein